MGNYDFIVSPMEQVKWKGASFGGNRFQKVMHRGLLHLKKQYVSRFTGLLDLWVLRWWFSCLVVLSWSVTFFCLSLRVSILCGNVTQDVDFLEVWRKAFRAFRTSPDVCRHLDLLLKSIVMGFVWRLFSIWKCKKCQVRVQGSSLRLHLFCVYGVVHCGVEGSIVRVFQWSSQLCMLAYMVPYLNIHIYYTILGLGQLQRWRFLLKKYKHTHKYIYI